MKRKEVYEVLDSERDYQDLRWGDVHANDYKSYPPSQFCVDFRKIINDLELSCYHMNKIVTSDCIRKIGALAVKYGEVHGMNKRV